MSQELCQTASTKGGGRGLGWGWGRGEGVRLSFAQDPFVKMDGVCVGVVHRGRAVGRRAVWGAGNTAVWKGEGRGGETGRCEWKEARKRLLKWQDLFFSPHPRAR